MARLALTGDVMLGRNVAEVIGSNPPEHVWGDTLDVLRGADALWINLECTIAEAGEPARGPVFHFRAPPRAVQALQAAGVDGCSLANNHALDFGPEALLETLEHLDRAGIWHVGAGRTNEEAWREARQRVDGLDVAVVAFTDNRPGWSVERVQPGLAHAEVDPEGPGFAQLEREVAGLSREADVVIVSGHWGPNMRREPPEAFGRFARGLLDAGADLLWGHSAHLFQAVERHRSGAILYDTGDLVDDYRRDPRERNDLSLLFEVEVTRRRVGPIRLVPVVIDPKACQVNLAEGSEAAWIRSRMRELCEPFGTTLERDGQALVAPG